jgi:tagatose-6-phosphate ketose/aldose isomerase
MKSFNDLTAGTEAERATRGTLHTVVEILQQPECLLQVLDDVKGRWDELSPLARRPLVFLGAGSSAYIGDMLVPAALARGLEARSVPTTDVVSHPTAWLGHGDCLYVSFARSGDSPESLAAVDLAVKLHPQAGHVGITCNDQGTVAKVLRDLPGTVVLTMPPATNDKSLAMTSSVSSMYAAGLALIYAQSPRIFKTLIPVAARLLRDTLDGFGQRVFGIMARKPRRAQYLGAGVNFGVARETRLKMQEMTEGKLVTQFESYLGLRHGPQVFVNAECLVIAFVSTDPRARLYELELLNELSSKKQGLHVVAVCDRDDGKLAAAVDEVFEIDPQGLLAQAAASCGAQPEELDSFLAPCHLAVGQMLATAASLDHGLKPDSPSERGIINRVVQGVTIVPWTKRSLHESRR